MAFSRNLHLFGKRYWPYLCCVLVHWGHRWELPPAHGEHPPANWAHACTLCREVWLAEYPASRGPAWLERCREVTFPFAFKSLLSTNQFQNQRPLVHWGLKSLFRVEFYADTVILLYRNIDFLNKISESHDGEKISCVGNNLAAIGVSEWIGTICCYCRRRKDGAKGQGQFLLYIMAKDSICYEPSIYF